jgi:uncharacterized lipoprotein YajG
MIMKAFRNKSLAMAFLFVVVVGFVVAGCSKKSSKVDI